MRAKTCQKYGCRNYAQRRAGDKQYCNTHFKRLVLEGKIHPVEMQINPTDMIPWRPTGLQSTTSPQQEGWQQ